MRYARGPSVVTEAGAAGLTGLPVGNIRRLIREGKFLDPIRVSTRSKLFRRKDVLFWAKLNCEQEPDRKHIAFKSGTVRGEQDIAQRNTILRDVAMVFVESGARVLSTAVIIHALLEKPTGQISYTRFRKLLASYNIIPIKIDVSLLQNRWCITAEMIEAAISRIVDEKRIRNRWSRHSTDHFRDGIGSRQEPKCR